MKAYCNNIQMPILWIIVYYLHLLVAFWKLLVVVEDRGDYVLDTTTLHKLNLPLAYEFLDLIHGIFTVFN